jgi:prophage tail gpP-like protein
LAETRAADLSECVLRLDTYGIEIPRWTSYTFSQDFLTPAAGFSFSIGDPDIPQGISGKIREGLKVGLMVDGHTICTGFIDEVHYEASHGSGTVLTLSGRDALGDAIDSTIDPTRVYAPTDTLAKIVQDVMEQFGFLNEPITDNEANRNLISGNKYGFKVNKAGGGGSKKKRRRSKTAGQAVKSFTNYQSQPHNHEGAYEFCERLAKRSGLHIWCTGDGVDLVVGRPDFAQDARYRLTRRRGIVAGAHNNVLSGGATRSRKNQPSMIVAGGGGGGGNVARATNKVIMVNELVSLQADGTLVPAVQQIIDKYPHAYVIGPADLDGEVSPLALNPYPRAKPLYLFDAEARDPENLKNFVMREMATRQRTSISCSYEVAGHSQNGVTWTVDTIVSVEDDVADIHEDMWIESVTFSKDRGQGTRTHLQLIRPYTLQL